VLRPVGLRRLLASTPTDWFVSYEGQVFRALAETDLVHATRSNPHKDHRFNRGSTPAGSFPVLYASTDRSTPLFEARRRIQTATEIISAIGPATHLVVLAARLPNLLDIRRDAVRQKLRTSHEELTGNWWEFVDRAEGAPTQWLGQVLHELDGVCGLIYRSKYGTGDDVFVMHDRLGRGYVRLDRSEPII
jgi:hypothetical protein